MCYFIVSVGLSIFFNYKILIDLGFGIDGGGSKRNVYVFFLKVVNWGLDMRICIIYLGVILRRKR